MSKNELQRKIKEQRLEIKELKKLIVQYKRAVRRLVFEMKEKEALMENLAGVVGHQRKIIKNQDEYLEKLEGKKI